MNETRYEVSPPAFISPSAFEGPWTRGWRLTSPTDELPRSFVKAAARSRLRRATCGTRSLERHERTTPGHCRRRFSSFDRSKLVFPSPLNEHRRSHHRSCRGARSSWSSSSTSLNSTPSKATLVSTASPSLDSVSAYLSMSLDAPRTNKQRASKLFSRRSRAPSSSSTLVGSPIVTKSISLESLKSWELVASPTQEAAPELPAPVVKDQSKARRIPRKAVPSFSEHESSNAAESTFAEDPQRTPSSRQPSRPGSPAGTLWSETCDERDLTPLPLDAGRRESAGSTLSFEEDYAATCAMLIASYRRRASIPSPAAIAANDALSPRLARLAAFTNTLESIAGGAAQGRRLSMEEAGATSFELPDLELPWLPTLFPDGTPIVDPFMTSPASSPPASYAPTFSSPASTAKATFPSASTPIRLVGNAPSSPALSGTTCYPRSFLSSSPSVASSASFTSSRRSSESSCSSSSSAGDSLVSAYSSLASTPPKESDADCSALSEARQTTFSVVAADGTNILLTSPATASPSPVSTSLTAKHALVPPRSAARTAAGRTRAGRRPAPSTAGLSRAWTQVEGENDEGEEVVCVGLRV